MKDIVQRTLPRLVVAILFAWFFAWLVIGQMPPSRVSNLMAYVQFSFIPAAFFLLPTLFAWFVLQGRTVLKVNDRQKKQRAAHLFASVFLVGLVLIAVAISCWFFFFVQEMWSYARCRSHIMRALSSDTASIFVGVISLLILGLNNRLAAGNVLILGFLLGVGATVASGYYPFIVGFEQIEVPIFGAAHGFAFSVGALGLLLLCEYRRETIKGTHKEASRLLTSGIVLSLTGLLAIVFIYFLRGVNLGMGNCSW